MQPVTVSGGEAEAWRDGGSPLFSLACAWARYAPRAKGWFPRLVGRRFGPRVEVRMRTASGVVMAIEPSSLDVYCAIRRFQGFWEPDVLGGCIRHLRPDDTFLDLGANVGIVSLEVSKHFAGRVRVFAFEPQPWLARAVSASAALNGFTDLKVFAAMVGAKSGEGELYVPQHSMHASAVAVEAGARVVRCPVVTVDQMVADGSVTPPDVMKVDVEGGEWDVFRGAEHTLRTHRPTLIFESNTSGDRFGYTRAQVCDYLRGLADYEFFALTGGRFEPLDLERHNLVSDVAAVSASRSNRSL